jgi:integrase
MVSGHSAPSGQREDEPKAQPVAQDSRQDWAWARGSWASLPGLDVAGAYRLLKAILNTAADDGAIKRNRAGSRAPVKRTHPSGQSSRSARSRPGRRHRAAVPRLVLLATFSSLRWGELGALCRCDIDLEARTVRVARQLAQVRGGGFT